MTTTASQISQVARARDGRIIYTAPDAWQEGRMARLAATERGGLLYCALTGEQLSAETEAAIREQLFTAEAAQRRRQLARSLGAAEQRRRAAGTNYSEQLRAAEAEARR